MNEDSLPMVRRLVDCLYTADYNTSVESQGTDPIISELQVHVEMFALGDKYDIEALRMLSSEKYSICLDNSPTGLDFLGSVPDVYDLTEPSLRNLTARFARHNPRKFLEDQSTRETYERIAVDVPEFIKDVLDLYMETPLLGSCYDCGPHTPMNALETRCIKCRRDCGSIATRPLTTSIYD